MAKDDCDAKGGHREVEYNSNEIVDTLFRSHFSIFFFCLIQHSVWKFKAIMQHRKIFFYLPPIHDRLRQCELNKRSRRPVLLRRKRFSRKKTSQCYNILVTFLRVWNHQTLLSWWKNDTEGDTTSTSILIFLIYCFLKDFTKLTVLHIRKHSLKIFSHRRVLSLAVPNLAFNNNCQYMLFNRPDRRAECFAFINTQICRSFFWSAGAVSVGFYWCFWVMLLITQWLLLRWVELFL